MAKKTVAAKKRNVKVEAMGQLHVHSSFNNIIVALANAEGQVISWSSAGKMGFRGSKKNTPYAAQMAAQDCAKVAFDLGLRKVKAYVKGPGNGRESAIRTVHGAGIEVTETLRRCPITVVVLLKDVEYNSLLNLVESQAVNKIAIKSSLQSRLHLLRFTTI